MRAAHSAALALALVGSVGCDGRPPPPPSADEYADEELPPQILEEGELDSRAPPPPALAEGAARAPSPDTRDRRPPVIPTTSPDREHESTEPVRARRYVYRVRMVVPGGLGNADDRIARPSPELFVDVSHDRLRARFVGSGWPVPAGSEVRLRRDRPGLYLFDPEGGRPLAPGELATWFEGGPVTRRGPPLRVIGTSGSTRNAPAYDREAPGELVCALLAEWWAERRDGVLRRCDRGAPHLFRLGFWRAEQTAGVPVELPRTALRADEGDAPGYIPPQSSRALLEPAALGRIAPSGPVPADAVEEDAPAEGLRISNESAARAIVTVQGVPMGWLDAGTTAYFVGLRPGLYEIGAIRPLGAVVQRGRPVPVPGTHRVCDGRCR